mmetsp:Transcript_135617/g.191883  ORF Transcript_135617/g.191883 Transcript_135617/m.191883 type:complete len:98 (+) Transcript_135617:113-406(+)
MRERLTVAYRRSAKAMFATSSTTCAAFIATGFSEILPISGFGYFAAVLIPVNFLIITSIFPAALVIWERHINYKYCPPKKPSQVPAPESPAQVLDEE